MPIPSPVMTIERRLARDATYDTLRDWIVDGTLEPGEKLRDTALAEALGVSRMPVREALLRLENEGLVQTSANRWTRVAPLDPGQASELCPIVWALECLALSRLDCPVAERDINALRASNASFEAALDAHDPVAAASADDDFHRVVVQQARNAEISRILVAEKAKLRRLEIAYFGGCAVSERAADEHVAIIDALEAGDIKRATAAVRADWQRILQRFEAAGQTGREVME